MIQNIKFSRINTDVDDHEIRPDEGEYRMMENLVPPKKGKGTGFMRDSIPGTSEISVGYTGTHKVIGFFEDAPNNRGFYFLWEESGSPRKDRIVMYDASTKTTTEIVASEFLEWTEDLKIEGISVLDDVIYWTDPEMRYFRIQDNSQLIEINYYAREITDSSTNNYFFQAAHEDGSYAVNINVPVTGPLSISDVLTSIADQFNTNSPFSSMFFASKEANSEVIKINAKSITGNWVLTNNSTHLYYFYSTNYDPVPESSGDFSMYPIGPSFPPQLLGVFDSNIPINNIAIQNWQFSYRFIYTNNQISVFSPYSEFFPSAKFPEDLINIYQINKIQVLMPIGETDKYKSVELAVRVNQNSDFFIIKEFTRNELFLDSRGIIIPQTGLFYDFIGTEIQIPIPTADMIKQQEGQPRETIDTQISKNKLFVIENLAGFNVDPGDFILETEIKKNVFDAGKRWVKDAGRYTYGIRFFDQSMRTDGTVHKSINVSLNDESYATNGKLSSQRKRVDVSLSGKPPEWAYFYNIVRSDELFYESFIQTQCYINYWVRPMDDEETYADFQNDTEHYAMWGQVYLRSDQDQNDLTKWKYIHLHMPTNLPFLVQRGMIVNLGANFPLDAYGSVLDVTGPLIIIDKPPNTTVFVDGEASGWFEILESKKAAQENSFYEIGEMYPVWDPGESTRSFAEPSDPFVIETYGGVFYKNNIFGSDGVTEDKRLNWKYDFENYTTNGSFDYNKGIPEDKFLNGYFETYSPSYQATQISVISEVVGVATAFDTVLDRTPVDIDAGIDFGYINNQSLATRNLGRPAVLIQNTREESRPSTLRWSNDYIENATINGLHTFEPLNSYPLPLERGPVNKLQNVGNDIMLAIHSSGVTSLYIGKGIIRSADLDPTLITTEGVIGTDNQLKYSYGTVHASSVTEIDGNAYFWDGVRNEPVRYAQNGLTPLATTFKARVFFKETIPALFGAPDTYDCISEYDRLLNIIWFTFLKGATKLTIGFHESSTSWIGKVGFTPEYFGAIGDQFLGFVNGVPWLHNEDDVNHNTFYGVAYKSKVNLDININASFEKAWMGMMVDSNKKWDIPVISNIEGQASDLVANDFVWRDNIYYADFLRDTNTPVEMLSGNQIALRHGKFLSSQVLSIEMELDSTEPHYLNSISVAAVLKPGHHVQREKKQ